MSKSTIDVDNIIERLLAVRGNRPGKQVQLSETEIKFLCTKSRAIFQEQPILLELEAPIKICGAFADARRFCLRIKARFYVGAALFSRHFCWFRHNFIIKY